MECFLGYSLQITFHASQNLINLIFCDLYIVLFIRSGCVFVSFSCLCSDIKIIFIPEIPQDSKIELNALKSATDSTYIVEKLLVTIKFVLLLIDLIHLFLIFFF